MKQRHQRLERKRARRQSRIVKGRRRSGRHSNLSAARGKSNYKPGSGGRKAGRR